MTGDGIYHVVGKLDIAVGESMAGAVGGNRILVHDEERDKILVAEPRSRGEK